MVARDESSARRRPSPEYHAALAGLRSVVDVEEVKRGVDALAEFLDPPWTASSPTASTTSCASSIHIDRTLGGFPVCLAPSYSYLAMTDW